MATAAYNSPYTGAQLDETIRKITSNNIHTYVELFQNAAGVDTGISLNSLPAGPDGTRNGVYDIEFGTTSVNMLEGAALSRMFIHDASTNAQGSGHTGYWKSGTDGMSSSVNAIYNATTGKIHIEEHGINLTTADIYGRDTIEIYRITRQDTIK